MNFMEDFRVSQEGAQTRISAQIDRPPAIFGPRIVRRVGIPKDAPTQGDEGFVFPSQLCLFRHGKRYFAR